MGQHDRQAGRKKKIIELGRRPTQAGSQTSQIEHRPRFVFLSIITFHFQFPETVLQFLYRNSLPHNLDLLSKLQLLLPRKKTPPSAFFSSPPAIDIYKYERTARDGGACCTRRRFTDGYRARCGRCFTATAASQQDGASPGVERAGGPFGRTGLTGASRGPVSRRRGDLRLAPAAARRLHGEIPPPGRHQPHRRRPRGGLGQPKCAQNHKRSACVYATFTYTYNSLLTKNRNS